MEPSETLQLDVLGSGYVGLVGAAGLRALVHGRPAGACHDPSLRAAADR